jgi:hypothetical protein
MYLTAIRKYYMETPLIRCMRSSLNMILATFKWATLILIIHPLIIQFLLCHRLHGEDNVAIKRYVISFWNGVDLRYKLLKGPSVKISIAGIIISRVSASNHFILERSGPPLQASQRTQR